MPSAATSEERLTEAYKAVARRERVIREYQLREMSERISFTFEELQQLRHLLSEARESLDEDATEEEYRLSNEVDTKINRAWSKARRKREEPISARHKFPKDVL